MGYLDEFHFGKMADELDFANDLKMADMTQRMQMQSGLEFRQRMDHDLKDLGNTLGDIGNSLGEITLKIFGF